MRAPSTTTRALCALAVSFFAAGASAQTLTPGNLLVTATDPATGVANVFLLDSATGGLVSLHAGAPLVTPRHLPSVTSVNPYTGVANLYIADGTSTRFFRLTDTAPAVVIGAWNSPATIESVINWDEARRITDDMSSLFVPGADTQTEDDLFMFHDARQRFGSPFAPQATNAVTSLTATSLRMLNPSNLAGQQFVAIGSSQMSGPHGAPIMSTLGSVQGVNDGRWSVAVLFGPGGPGNPPALRVFDESAGQFVTILSDGPLASPRALSPMLNAPIDDGFYVANAKSIIPGGPEANIIRVNSDGTHSVVSTGGFLNRPAAIVVDDAGFIVVADELGMGGVNGTIVRIDPATGAQTEIRRGSASVGFRNPRGLSLLRCQVPVWQLTSNADAVNASPGDGSPVSVNGAITLRVAVTEANLHPCGGAIVRVPAGTATIDIFGFDEDNNLTGDIDVHSFVRIRGAGMHDTIIDVDTLDRAFDAHAGGALVLSELTVRNGLVPANAGAGGGVRSRESDLTLRRIRVESCSGPGGTVNVADAGAIMRDCEIVGNTGGGNGGGAGFSRPVPSPDPLDVVLVDRCLFEGNAAGLNGGGATAFRVDARFSNCTFVGNSAGSSGGAISVNVGVLSIDHCTIVGNSAATSGANPDSNGGGVSIINASGTIGNSIIAVNSAAGGTPDLGQGNPTTSHIITAGYNLIGNVSGVAFTGDTSTHLVGVNPGLGPLADNGGHTRTRVPIASSPAVDNADPATTVATDQRAVARPVDGNFNGVARADIGAVERIPTCQGDVNGDGVIDFTDLSAVLGNFGQSGVAIYGDTNGDNMVDFTDLSVVLSLFGTPCP